MKQKYYVELNRQEWRLIIEGLNRFRNKLIAAGRYTDAVDEILLKVAKARKLSESLTCHWKSRTRRYPSLGSRRLQPRTR